MKKLSLVLCVLSTMVLTACGSSGSSNNNAVQNCGITQTYPYNTNTTNCNNGGAPAGYTYVNGQLVYTGTGVGAGYAGVGYTNPQQAGYGSNPCLVYGPTWFPSNGMCMSYY